MRIIKNPHERKKEFLAIARKLFFAKGYEQTSVDEIIKAVGLSKGSFYYYFKSKEDLLNELTKDLIGNILVQVQKIVNSNNLNAVAKLNKAFGAIALVKLNNIELIMALQKAFYDDQNIYFRYKVYQNSTDILAPEFAKIIKQGIRERYFSTPYPDETARLFFELSFIIGERLPKLILEIDQNPDNFSQIIKILEHYQISMERIIGAQEGTIRIFSHKLLQDFWDKMKINYHNHTADKSKKQNISNSNVFLSQ